MNIRLIDNDRMLIFFRHVVYKILLRATLLFFKLWAKVGRDEACDALVGTYCLYLSIFLDLFLLYLKASLQ